MPDESMYMPLSGYTDRLSARAGETIEVKVSSHFPQDYSADLVRIYSADPNPDGPGLDIRPVAAGFEGHYKSVAKIALPGSYGVIPLTELGCFDDMTLALRFQPRLLREAPQGLFSLQCADESAVRVSIDAAGVLIETHSVRESLCCDLETSRWYELRLHRTAGRLKLACYAVSTGIRVTAFQGIWADWDGTVSELILAAARKPDGSSSMTSFFNGRLENPAILSGAQLPEKLENMPADECGFVAFWDFARDIGTDRLTDRGRYGLHGRLFNLPTRGVRGSQWTGTEMCWRYAADEYAAAHFHEGDLYDCGWETDFRFDIPAELPSGVYGIRLCCEDAEEIVPVFVRPANDGAKAKIAVLFSTFTYQAYSNYPRTNYDASYRERSKAWGSNPYHPARYPQFGRSLYDVHADGSGVMFSSVLRPQLLMRPGLFAYLDEQGSGLRHFPADMHLIAWLDAKRMQADIITDHDLDEDGFAALAGYDLVMTVTHPEYHTPRTLDAIERFTGEGGNFAYLGGNGFYWRIATSDAFPGAIELRRGESGVRMWEAETGECFHAFDGQYGGLWLKNGRPPQSLVGIGMSAHGPFCSSYYRRTGASRDPEFAWLFAGIEEDIIGDFGFSGGGAAGFELDAADRSLGTPQSAVVLARSEDHSPHYACVPEKVWNPDVHTSEWQREQIRADLCLVPMSKGNFVFSTGSIMFCGSLPSNGYENNISRLLENFVRRCLQEE